MRAPDPEPTVASPARRLSPLRAILAAAWGLAAGTISLAIGLAVAKAVAPAPEPRTVVCDGDDLGCLPDVGPIIVAFLAIIVVVPLVSPLVAWILRLPGSWWFLLPGVWVSVLAMAGLTVSIPNNLVVIAILALAPYALLAVWRVAKRSSPH